MSRVKLTDAFVARATLPLGTADVIVWDADLSGFGLRIRATGKSWIVAYRPAGAGRSANMKKLRLGSADTLKAADARTLARVELGKVAAGSDPMAKRNEQKLKERARLGDLLDDYEADLERRRYVNYKVVASGLRTKLKGLLHRDVREITGADLATIIKRYEQAGRPGAGADFRSRCRAFFTWLVTKPKVIAANPLAGFRKERATRADRIERAQHGRALTDDELVKVWRAADSATVFGRWVRLLVLTGCRRGEAAGLTWSMVDRKARLIRLPAVFTKQGRGHVVPIVPALEAVLDACHVDARSDLVFASPRSGGALKGYTQLHRRFVKASGVAFLFHDLRRTFRTGLSRLRIDNDTAELALGHARGDLESRYNRDDAVDELRDAFERWANHLLGAVQKAQKREAEDTMNKGVFG